MNDLRYGLLFNTVFRLTLINAIFPFPERDGKRFSTFEISENLNIKRTRLQEWIDKGYVTPSICRAKGKGTKALFSNQDIYHLHMFRELLDIGLNRYMAARIVRERRTLGDCGERKTSQKAQAYSPGYK